jgi:hypothetical protein
MRRIGLLLVAVAALVAFKVSTAEGPQDGLAAGVVGSATVTGGAVANSVFGRARHTIGMSTSRVIGPSVGGMTVKTNQQLAELQPAIRRAPARNAARARAVEKRIAESDSLAFHSLAVGRPIEAVRFAMKSRSLVDAVRHQVAEQNIR